MRTGKRNKWSGVWTGSIVAALVASVGIFAAMMQVEKKMLNEYERGSIYAAAQEIPKGQMITRENFTQFLVEKELAKDCIPKSALQDPEQITGLVVKEKTDEGALLTMGMFEELNQITEKMQQPVIAGFKAEDLYQVVGGVLRAGDRIHIYTVSESGQAALIWREVFVEQVFDNGGLAIDNKDDHTAAQRINIYLDAKDVEGFYTELARGTLRVVKVCR